VHDDLGLAIFASIPNDPTMVITYTYKKKKSEQTKRRKKNSILKKEKGRAGRGWDGEISRTDPHAGQGKIVGLATTDRDERVGLQKVDAAQRGVAGLQAAKERALHWVYVVPEEDLRRLLRRALRLTRIFVLPRSSRVKSVHG
jgi:hypothetical protein